jgi:CelD/BcsL family acetyltransferase involved in cellulose biosynthesis
VDVHLGEADTTTGLGRSHAGPLAYPLWRPLTALSLIREPDCRMTQVPPDHEPLEPVEAGEGPPSVVSVIEDISAVDALRPEWDDLLGRAREASPFLSWDWQRGWWGCYGQGRSLRLHVARRAGRLVGLLPLYRETVQSAALRWRQLRLVGTGGDTTPDYLGALLDPEGAGPIARRLLASALDDGRWDVLSLSDVGEGSILQGAFLDVTRRRGLPIRIGPPTRITVVPLPGSWEALLLRFDRHRRQEVQRRRRRLEELGARCFVWRDEADLDRAFERLAALHRRRWSGRAARHAFSSPEYLAFHREVMHRFLQRGWLRLFGLQIGEEFVAMRYCFRFRDEVFVFQSGFDPVYKRFAPGSALMAYVLEHSIQEGARLVDMLKGEYPHKEAWSREHRTTTHLRAFNRTLPGVIRRVRERELSLAAGGVRSLLGRGDAR